MRLAMSVVLFACATPALAVDGNSDSSSRVAVSGAGTTDHKTAEEPKICKRVESTESRLGAKKVCMTAEQWKEYDDSNKI